MAMAMAYRNWSNKSKAAAHRCQRTGLPEIVKNAPKFRREANQSIKLFKFTAREERERVRERGIGRETEREREGQREECSVGCNMHLHMFQTNRRCQRRERAGK